LIAGLFWVNYAFSMDNILTLYHSRKIRFEITILMLVTLFQVSCEEGMIVENPPFIVRIRLGAGSFYL